MSNLPSSADKAQIIELLNSVKIPIMGAGGGFAPIGTENYFEGTSASQGWLLCDGSTYNIADYPELATYYASHYGASNHFGGDGVTTFAVPTKEGMPENTDSVYGEQERIVGVWKETVDGVLKQKPVYKSEYSGLNVDVVYNTWTEVINIPDIEMIVNIEAYSYINSPIYLSMSGIEWEIIDSRPKNLNAEYNQNANVRPIKALSVQYTKTTDSWTLPTPGHSADGNGVFCVKATLSDAHLDSYKIYSPNEHQVGWWQEEIDGVLKQKPVYEKTIDCGSMPNSSSQDKYVDTNIQNIDYCMIYEATMYKKSSGEFSRLPIYNVRYGPSSSHSIQIMDTNRILLRSGGDSSSYSCNVVLRYTKTTDQWQVV